MAGVSAPKALLVLMLRADILLYVPPRKLNICLNLRGGVGQNGAHDAQFSATRSFHVASRAFCGWLFCPQCPADAHDARPYSCLRYPQQPDIRSLDLGMGVLGKTVLMMLFGGAAWNTGNPLLWWGFPAKTRLRKLSVPESAGEKRRSDEAGSAARPFAP